MADTKEEFEKTTKETTRKISMMNKVSGGAGASKPGASNRKPYVKKDPPIRGDAVNSGLGINKAPPAPLVKPKIATPASKTLGIE